MSKLETNQVDPATGTTLTLGTSGDTVTVPTGVGLTATDEVKSNKLSPATGTALQIGDSGDTITIPSGATIVNSGTQTGFGGTNTPAFMASLTTDQSISHNTNTKIAFANEVIDTDNTYDPSTNYRFTPGVVGKYMIGLGGWIYSSGGDIKDYSLYLYKNGSDITNTMYKNLNAFSERTNLDFHTIINVTSTSDYYEVYINQNSSGSNSVEFSASGNSAKFRNFFYAYKLIT